MIALCVTEDQAALICTGLRIACEAYAKNAGDVHGCGLNPVTAARLAEQFERQRVDTVTLIDTLENAE